MPDKHTGSLATRILPMLAIVVLLVILAWAGMRANAAWHYLAARSYMSAMGNQVSVSQAGIDNATGRVNAALRHFPGNPDYLDLAGKLQELQASRPGVVGRSRRKSLEAAASYYRRALSVRPLWPYSWANLLAVKDALGVVDDEFKLALERSIVTGPLEPRVQLQVLTSGLNRWDQLGTRQRDMVRSKTLDALKTQPREVFKVVRSYGRPDLVCVEAVEYSQITRWCAQVLKKAGD